MRGIVKIRSRNGRREAYYFREDPLRFAPSWSSSSLLPPVPGDTNDVLRRAITHSWIITRPARLLLGRLLFPRTTFRPIADNRYKIFDRSDRVLHEMSNEHEECFSDPLSARASFFSRNHGFFVNVVYLFPHEFFSFIRVSYTHIPGIAEDIVNVTLYESVKCGKWRGKRAA